MFHHQKTLHYAVWIIGGAMMSITLAGCKHDPKVERVKYLESAKRYEAEGKYKEASIQLANSLKADNSFAPAHFEMGKVYAKMGMMQSAYNEFSRAVELDQSNMDARLELGKLAAAGGQTIVAEEQAQKILSAQSDNADGHALMANVLSAKGDRKGAIDEMQRALAINPNKAAFHSQLGVIQSGDPKLAQDAQAEFAKALQLDSKETSARLALANMLMRNGNLAEAEKQLKDAVSVDPKNFLARVELAALYMKQKDDAKTEATLRKATEDLRDTANGAELLRDYYVNKGQPELADPAYADLIKRYPDSLPLKKVYEEGLISEGKIDEAQHLLDSMSSGHENDPEFALLKGKLLLRQGKSNEAFQTLQSASHDSPDDMQLKLWYGFAARAKGDIPAAQRALQNVLQNRPGDLAASQGLAAIASSQHDMNELRHLADGAISAHPESVDGYIWRASAQASDGQYEQAASDLETALKVQPTNSSALLEMAQVRMAQKRNADANTYLERAVAADGNMQALHYLVVQDVQSGNAAKAVQRIQTQIAKYPQRAPLLSELALVQLEQKQLPEAAATAKRAMQLAPNDSIPVKVYTQAQILSNNLGPAIQDWQQWTQSHPRDPQGFTILGMLTEASGNASGAMGMYKKALDVQSGYPIAANNLAYLMVETKGNLDMALTLAQSARSSMPNSPNAADTLAWVYYNKGLYDSARGLLEDAAKSDPNNATVHYHLGLTYTKLNMKNDAATQLKKAISLAPNTQTMKDAQSALNQIG